MSHEPNAILAISSTDRFLTARNRVLSNTGGVTQATWDQPTQNALEAQFFIQNQQTGLFYPPSNDFILESSNALMNGYIDKIVVSQIQLQYNVPTISYNRNDIFFILVPQSNGTNPVIYEVRIPYGFYTPTELAVIIQLALDSKLAEQGGTAVRINVNYSLDSAQEAGGGIGSGYTFTVRAPDSVPIYFLTPVELATAGVERPKIVNCLKTYKMLGITYVNTINFASIGIIDDRQVGGQVPDFLYTPYIDIYSDALTSYQNLKDTDTSVSKRKGLIARVYLSGAGIPNITNSTATDASGNLVSFSSSAGSYPFVLTADLNNPKVINWSKDSAINSLDFQLRDCYGDLLFVGPDVPGDLGDIQVFNTEFQITLLCVEGN